MITVCGVRCEPKQKATRNASVHLRSRARMQPLAMYIVRQAPLKKVDSSDIDGERCVTTVRVGGTLRQLLRCYRV